jgi:hypothetical protein
MERSRRQSFPPSQGWPLGAGYLAARVHFPSAVPSKNLFLVRRLTWLGNVTNL